TSAPLRAAQALHARPDCRVVGIRGNVQTRLAKLQAGEADVTLLALAGLNRLGMAHYGTPLDPQEWLPAPGQGAIAIECRSNDAGTRALLADIDDLPSRHAVEAERALLAALGGNCHSPISVLTRPDGDHLTMRAALLSPDGAERVDSELAFPPGDAAGPHRLAARLLAEAGPAIREHFDPPEG
ncbi:MAG: hydroxymethylbilane synthase, partial [Sphingomonadaceae bacterium]|nr:hydroxymethylbilane synthase [Sphingomonadaceae bacterium]